MALFFAINYLLWINGIARTALLLRARFIFLIFGVAAVMGGLVLSKIKAFKRPELDIPWLAQTVLGLALVFLLMGAVLEFLFTNPLLPVTGWETAVDYSRRRLGVYQDALLAINQLPPESEVVMLWEARSYGCEVLCHPDPILDRFLHMTQFYEWDTETIVQHWRDEGITHVLLAQGGLDFLLAAAETNPIGGAIRPEDLAVLRALQRDHLTVVDAWAGAYVLYEVTEP